MELLFREHVTDLILVATQNVGDDYGYLRQDNLLLLEIFLYMFTGQDPELVAKANLENKVYILSSPVFNHTAVSSISDAISKSIGQPE